MTDSQYGNALSNRTLYFMNTTNANDEMIDRELPGSVVDSDHFPSVNEGFFRRHMDLPAAYG